MDFKIGYKVKPKEINNLNDVIFEEFNGEGSFSDVIPTEDDCNGYGFIWVDDKCKLVNNNISFISNPQISKPNNNTEIHKNANYISVIGVNNKLSIGNTNDLIVGSDNIILDEVRNTIVSGTKAEATTDNSIVLGGNAPDDNLAERQFSTMMYGRYTTNGSTQSSYLNNTTSNFYQVPTDTAMYFHAEAIAVRVGGTGTGNIGDYGSYVQRGVVINKSGVLSVNSERDNIRHSGTTSTWRTSGNVSGTSFYIGVRGATNVNIEWSISIRFTEIRTGVAL